MLSGNRVQCWSKWALLNLVLVAVAGVLIRYKTLFPLPAIHYKNLLHGHSHFAFAGWVSTALYVAILSLLIKKGFRPGTIYLKLFIFLQISSFGMLLTFPIQGYAPWSIVFSTLSISFSYLFCWYGWRDINRAPLHRLVKFLLKTSLVSFAFSSLGAFALGYMMSAKLNDAGWLLSAAYFFLHFQYNGWFLFAIMGLFFQQLFDKNIIPGTIIISWEYHLLAISVIPAYFLSVLWMRTPVWIQLIAGMAAGAQMAAVIGIIRRLRPAWKKIRPALHKTSYFLWQLSALAFLIKIILQALSAIPTFSKFSFAYRPIVIGYLHLVLLGFVTLFLIGYFLEERMLANDTPLARWGLSAFVTGVILNEVFLMIQGIAILTNTGFPVLNYVLLGVVTLILAGITIFYSQQRSLR